MIYEHPIDDGISPSFGEEVVDGRRFSAGIFHCIVVLHHEINAICRTHIARRLVLPSRNRIAVGKIVATEDKNLSSDITQAKVWTERHDDIWE